MDEDERQEKGEYKEEVRIITTDYFQGGYVPQNVFWDGTDDQGNPVPSGEYLIEARPIDEKWKNSKRTKMETHYAVDMLSPTQDILLSYGEQVQIQRFTYGHEVLSMHFQSLGDKRKGDWQYSGPTATGFQQVEERSKTNQSAPMITPDTAVECKVHLYGIK